MRPGTRPDEARNGNGNGGWTEIERRSPARELEADAILRVLVEAKIDFVVIGGLAVAAHGFVRATKDVDIVPDPDPANLAAFEDVLTGSTRDRSSARTPGRRRCPSSGSRGLPYGGNWALDSDHGRIDVLQSIDQVEVIETYVELRDQALVVDIRDVDEVRFASVEHLELMKRVAGRPRISSTSKSCGNSGATPDPRRRTEVPAEAPTRRSGGPAGATRVP